MPPSIASISVLRYEKQLLDQQIAKYEGRLKGSELQALQSKGRALDKQAEDISARLTKGGVPAQNGPLCCLVLLCCYNIHTSW